MKYRNRDTTRLLIMDEEALVAYKLNDVHSEGQIERLRRQNEALGEMLGRLLKRLDLEPEALVRIVGTYDLEPEK